MPEALSRGVELILAYLSGTISILGNKHDAYAGGYKTDWELMPQFEQTTLLAGQEPDGELSDATIAIWEGFEKFELEAGDAAVTAWYKQINAVSMGQINQLRAEKPHECNRIAQLLKHAKIGIEARYQAASKGMLSDKIEVYMRAVGECSAANMMLSDITLAIMRLTV